MAKSDLDIRQIDTGRAYRNHIEPTHLAGKSINAFDTETCDGTVFMLSYAVEGISGVISNSSVDKLDSERIFEKITHRDCRQSNAINLWYNLDFDANAILSDILTNEQIAQLVLENTTTTEVNGIEYDIDYVKGKFLFFEDKHGNKYEHYDISQFFYTSLENAAETWLDNLEKEPMETALFGSNSPERLTQIVLDSDQVTFDQLPVSQGEQWTEENAIQYIKDNWYDIKEYAEKDAIVTQRLSEEIILEAESLNIPMGKPFSTGYISEEYKRENMDKKPGFGSQRYQKYFWDAYAGGRFEVFERGNIGEIAAPDINSAYPAVMSTLPDPSTLEWHYYANETDSFDWEEETRPFGVETLRDGDYGVVRVRVSTDPNERIQPFAYKHNGKVHYPALEYTEITTLTPIFLFALDAGIITEYSLIDTWIGHETEETEFPYDFVEDMYAERKDYEILKGMDKQGLLLKIVLNSMYGKTCQTVENIRVIEISEGENYEIGKNEKLLPKEFLSESRRQHLSENQFIIASYESGRHFNPFIASYITGMTRLKLHKSVHEYGLVDDTVMFATDCIMVRKEPFDESGFNELISVPNEDSDTFHSDAKESLGMWDYDYKGSGYIVGSGVYEVEKDDGSTKTKTRGFIESNLDGTLKELSRKHPDGIPVTNQRPVSLAELFTKQDKSVSQFVEPTKEISADFDEKRSWERSSVDFSDLLNSSEESSPIVVTNGKAPRTERINKIKQESISHQSVLEYDPLEEITMS